jgi:hypothetical protein
LIPGAPALERPARSKPTRPRVKVERTDKRLTVRAQLSEEEDFFDLATYVMDPNTRPYLHPVRDASGKVVLTEDTPADHPWQHGIFTGFHRVNGVNYWREDEGKQRFVRLLDFKQSPVSWRALTELVAPDGKVVLEEENAVVVHPPESADRYVIDFELLLRAKSTDVTFGKFFVGGLAVRMPWDEKNPRQTHLNSAGLRGRDGEQQRAEWCNVERPFGNETFGVAILDHPGNASHPPGWRVDEQGLINANVSSVADWSLPTGESRRFYYRILIYRSSASREQLQAEFEKFAATKLQ